MLAAFFGVEYLMAVKQDIDLFILLALPKSRPLCAASDLLH